MGQRQRSEATDDWQQLDLLVRFPEQRTYELIRPVVLFGYSPAERARLTGAPQRTLYRQAARFEREGMFSKVKTAVRRAGKREQEGLEAAIGTALDTVTGQDAAGWFTHCGYEPEQGQPL